MRVLGIGDSCDLGALYADLQAGGADVKVFISNPMCHGTLRGIVDRTESWRDELAWIREAGPEGFIVLENVAADRGLLQDTLRQDGYQVIGGSEIGDRLENDRAFAQEVLSGLGLRTAGVWEFTDLLAARQFLQNRPAKYVLKFNGPDFASTDNFVGQWQDGKDVLAVLEAKAHLFLHRPVSFILMEHVAGVEMGVGAYFNGHRFLEPACVDWEHKRFFAGDLGELTGEMGTVVTFDGSNELFETVLRPLTELLAKHRHCGYVNINTIVNKDGIWPLEFTCRFGYPGFAILSALQTSWVEVLRAMVSNDPYNISVQHGFAVGVVLTTPPFPYKRSDVPAPIGLPVLFTDDPDASLGEAVHLGEVGQLGTQLVTTGIYGWTLVVTGVGRTVQCAQEAAYRCAAKVTTPNLRYRLDIGDKLISQELAEVASLGWWSLPRPDIERGLDSD